MQALDPRTPSGLLLVGALLFPVGLIAQSLADAPARDASGGVRAASGASAILGDLSEAIATVARGASPSVVHIHVRMPRSEAGGRMPSDVPGFGHPFQERQAPVVYGQGSGFAIGDGLVLTNAHVVGHADRVEVSSAGGRTTTAEVVGIDAPSDVALLRVEDQDLPALPLGSSSELMVGEWVLAIGNPFGLDSSISSGIVSATGRSGLRILEYEDFIQTDAAINPGNSGGPLLDADGRVVGMNTAILSRSGSNSGVGLAIPVELIVAIKDELLESGRVERGFLGVYLQELEPGVAAALGVDDDGVLVTEVIADSPAETAGLRRDDVIVGLAGQAVRGVQPLRNRVSLLEPGEDVELTIARSGERRTLTVEIGELPGQANVRPASAPAPHEELGFDVQSVTPALADRFGLETDQGAVVTDVRIGSPAYEAGLRPGAIVLEVEREVVADARSLARRLRDAEPGDDILLYVRFPDQGSRYVVLERR